MKPVVTWILIADAGRGRIVSHTGPGNGLKTLVELTHDVPANRDLMADREGRSFARDGSGRRSGLARPSDPKRLVQREFATRLAARLEKGERSGAFDRLIVIAPAKTLGDLRTALSSAVRERVMAEISKDLTHVGDRDLPPHLDAVLAV